MRLLRIIKRSRALRPFLGRTQPYLLEQLRKYHVDIVEVGPRDGLQSERGVIPAATKAELINLLGLSGLRTIEAAAFVSPKWVPQMADSAKVMELITPLKGITYQALVPNMKGLQEAIAAGFNEVSVFASASEAFSQKNINCSISESVERFRPVCEAAKKHRVNVRAYVSCALGCPYEGHVTPGAVTRLAYTLVDLGCYQVSLADTIGVGTAGSTEKMLDAVTAQVPVSMLAVHFHDTYGQALANILVALQKGVRVVDSAIAGLGGCPYAAGATGNASTEDVLYMLTGLGVHTNVHMEKLLDATQYISKAFDNRPPQSRAAQALLKGRE
ncbi:unnamed protein product [Chrysoparadoxa australica]